MGFEFNRQVRLLEGAFLDDARRLLGENGLRLEDNVDFTLGVVEDGELLATASLTGKVIKCLAVAKEHRGRGLTALLIGELSNRLADEGIHHRFVYTQAPSAELLLDLGFSEIARVGEELVLLEAGLPTVEDWYAKLAAKRQSSSGAASVVVNANPLTKGHLHLLETAKREQGVLHILVVSEERSSFSAKDRLSIIERATADWDDTFVHEAGDYIVSMATFPAYFSREEDLARLQAALDVELFRRYVVPALGITTRYVGEEPYCPITRLYNEVMGEVLPRHGIAFKVIERKSFQGEAISASRVRTLLREGVELDSLAELIPDSTLEFLKSRRGREVIHALGESSGRH